MHRDPMFSETLLGRRVLIIDDDKDIRTVLCDRLIALGFDIVQADNGESGLSQLAVHMTRTPIHGILLDLHMPVLSGMAVLQELRYRHTQIPVIVMSDLDNIASVREAIQLGAQEYLLKPFDYELLKKKCLRLFQN